MPTSPDMPVAPPPVVEAGVGGGLNLQVEQANLAAEENALDASAVADNLDKDAGDPNTAINKMAAMSTSAEFNGLNQGANLQEEQANLTALDASAAETEQPGANQKNEASDSTKQANENGNSNQGNEQEDQTSSNTKSEDQKSDPKTEDAKTQEKNKKISDLEQKVKDRTATPEQMKELHDLKHDPNKEFEERRQKLEDKVLNDTATPFDRQELYRMNQEGKSTSEEELLKKETAENKTEKSSTDEQLQEIQQRLGAMLEKNKDKLETATVTVSAKDLLLLMQALAGAKETNPKKKESKLMLLLKLLGVLLFSGVVETGKEAAPVNSKG
jgi:hypothetical protein